MDISEILSRYNIEHLNKDSKKEFFLITCVKTEQKWVVKKNNYSITTGIGDKTKKLKVDELTLMQTNGEIVDETLYFDYLNAKHAGSTFTSREQATSKTPPTTLYDFYYDSKYEFDGHRLNICNKRFSHDYRSGDYFESESYAPSESDGFAFSGQNNYEIGGNPVQKFNPQLDWYVFRDGWIMYDNYIEGTQMFRKRDGGIYGGLDDIDPDECTALDTAIIRSLKLRLKKCPEDPYDLLPMNVRQSFREVAFLVETIYKGK